jgi:DNA polymerase I
LDQESPAPCAEDGVPQASSEGESCAPQPQRVDIKGWDVYAVDAHSLIFQVFHALPEMSSPRGEPVGAVYGFVRDMLYLIEEKKPDALSCAGDLAGPTFRSELFDAYKAERGEMPDELPGQIAKIEQVLEALAIPVLACEGFEADDVLATIARLCDEGGANCFLVTGVKDCRQLLSDRVAVYNIRKNQVFDAAALRQEWGVEPDQVVDFQALVGDKIDNIPGVPGIGPKTARQLLETYGTLDNLLEHAHGVPGAKGKRLAESRESALLSRQLVRLDTQVPIVPDWDASRVGGMNHRRLAELFTELGFRTFAERVARVAPEGKLQDHHVYGVRRFPGQAGIEVGDIDVGLREQVGDSVQDPGPVRAVDGEDVGRPGHRGAVIDWEYRIDQSELFRRRQ